MKQQEMNKINRRIQEFKDAFRPEVKRLENHVKLDTRKRNQAKRLARKLRGK